MNGRGVSTWYTGLAHPQPVQTCSLGNAPTYWQVGGWPSTESPSCYKTVRATTINMLTEMDHKSVVSNHLQQL